MQPPGVSTEGHGAEVGGAEDRGAGGCCFACRLLSLFPSASLTLEPWDGLVFLGSEKAESGIVGNMG